MDSDAGTALSVRLAPDLWLFVVPRRRREQIEVRYDGDATLGHVVEALGVPLTEVGTLRSSGATVTASYRPHPGDTIEVRSLQRPQQVPGWSGQFLLDVHLGTLARRLRILGIDAAYRNDADDDALVDEAADQRRVLLTQDRGLLKRRALWAGAYVRGAQPGEQLADVLNRFAPTLVPWTRCTTCNGEVDAVAKHEVSDRLPAGTRRRYDHFTRCRRCGRVYWHGAHSRRLDAIVAAARSDRGRPAPT
ncbi:Mut7-C ubiquitin/RNAse domain-containing protein [Pseudonocardia sp. H11422]|uniref:Mut7-C ubiquitin/RNAse domain-containing protein n=1 Tax=Pseudonocardia sp. H11422 TaxID=2835866 RepID=UPI001BDD80FD|nr:Mut7-C ubiquitin/RNAse domain-containing protein [Pseudonocardia sp. H11422]